jgi:hypothetical protein
MRVDRLFRLLIVVTVTAVVASGCLRAEAVVEVDENGAGRLELTIEPVERRFGRPGWDPAVDLRDVVVTATDALPGVDVERVGDEGVRVTLRFDDHQDLSAVLTSPLPIVGGAGVLFRSFDIVDDGEGRWRFRAVSGLGPDGSLLDGAAGSMLGAMLGDAIGAGRLRLTVQLPGQVVDANTDAIDGGAATWTLIGDDAATELRMDNEPGGLSTLSIGLIAAGGALVLGLLLLLVTAAGRSRRRNQRFEPVLPTTAGPSTWSVPDRPMRPPVAGPAGRTSAPPHSAQPVDPTDPFPPGPAGPFTEGAPGGPSTWGAPAGPTGPATQPTDPVTQPIAPPVWPPVQPTQPTGERLPVGPPPLPPGMVPNPTNAFPETHPVDPPVDRPPVPPTSTTVEGDEPAPPR